MITFLFKIRLILDRLPRLSPTHALLLWAALIGVVGAIATIIFKEGLSFLQRLVSGHSGSLVAMAETFSWPIRIALPTIGGVIAGLLLMLAEKISPSSKADYMEAIAIGNGHIPVITSLLRSISSLFTIASGGSIGREGSMVQLSAMCASVAGQRIGMDSTRLRLLVACGAGAGITAAYNAPIASAFFVTEIVLGSIVINSFGPILVSAVVANIVMREMPGYHPVYALPNFPAVSEKEMVLFVILGGFSGLLAPQFLKLLKFSKQIFSRSSMPLPMRLAIGGLGVGIISVWVPEVWGNGYSVVNSLIHQPWLWSSLLTILICKVVATAFTAGSGAVGGVFTPALFVGAAVGVLFGQLVNNIWPGATSLPFAYAIIGMGAFLAAATNAPLMAILMMFEMTLSYQVMLPLMLACVLAYFIAQVTSGMSMYEITVKRNREEKNLLKIRGGHVRDLIQKTDTVLPMSANIDDMARIFLQHPVKYIYIIDDHNYYQGVVALQDLSVVMADKAANKSQTAEDFLRRDFLQVLTPGMNLSEAFQHFQVHQGERLPAVQSPENPVFLGTVFKTSLLDAFFRLSQMESVTY